MHRHLRRIAAIGFLGCATMGVMPFGCASRLGPVQASQTKGGIDRPELPDITLAQGSECVAEYARQLPPGRHEFDLNVEVYEDGSKKGVTIDDLPNTAYDFGACMRNAFLDMPIAEEPLRQGVETLKYRREQTMAAQRSLVSSPVVVVVAGVTIVVTELMLEAGAYTLLFAVTVKVVEKAAEDVKEDGWKAVCIAKYAACIAAVGTFKRGNHLGASRCNTCMERCLDDHEWPSSIGNGSCEFWKRNWK
jgi:hypothetical protein